MKSNVHFLNLLVIVSLLLALFGLPLNRVAPTASAQGSDAFQPVVGQADSAHPTTPPTLAQLAAASGLQVDTELIKQLTADQTTGYLIYFKAQPDLSPAYQMSWDERGQFVMQTLQAVAQKSQASVRADLDAQRATYQSFWIDNVIAVDKSDLTTVNRLLTHSEIAALRARIMVSLIEPAERGADLAVPSTPNVIESNITHVKADQAWGQGIDGAGGVVASIDTGVRYTHQALVSQYRGNLGGGNFDHNYNWWDPYGDHPTAPADDNGHGSHTMGTMVGNDGGANQIGMAPGAEWLACRGCNNSSCTDAALLMCAQFMAAPWNLSQANPDPAKRPYVVNNSWGDCSTSYDPWYQAVVNNWQAAGIYPVFSNGNASNCSYSAPPAANTVGNPARYGNVTGVGSSGQNDGQYASHSNRGPSDNPDTINPRGYPTIKPQVVAPGVNIRSSIPTSDSSYEGGWTGTSMSAPHVSGLIALMWQAGSCLKGDYARTETLLEQTATPITIGLPADNPTGEGPGKYPNQSTGWGEINALAAVQAARIVCGNSGVLAGQVTTPLNTPVADVIVQATASPTQTTSTVTDLQGNYALWLEPDRAYTVSVSTYGYAPYAISAISVVTTTTTTLNISLTPQPTHVISGFVTDATTGWPLYAQLTVSALGLAGRSVWNDPVTGYYSFTLAAGITHTIQAQAWVQGYLAEAVNVAPLSGNITLNVGLDADTVACNAPGYGLTGGLAERFDTLTPPSLGDWTSTVVDLVDAPAWATNAGTVHPTDVAAHSAPNLAYFNSYDVNTGGSARLARVTGFNMTGVTSTTLSFWMYHDSAYDTAVDEVQVQVSSDGGTTWTNVGAHVLRYSATEGWLQHSVDLSAYATQTDLRLAFLGTSDYGNDIHIDDIVIGTPTCVTPTGGLVVGNVYDANTALGLNDAVVTSPLGDVTTSATLDPAVDDGFFIAYAPAGSQTFTVTKSGGYVPASQSVGVSVGGAVEQNFNLLAGQIAVNAPVASTDITLTLNATASTNITLSNAGGAAANYTIAAVNTPLTWLTWTPVTGTLANSAQQVVALTYDAGQVNQPGVYQGTLLVEDNTPYTANSFGVRMTVPVPNTWGKLAGLVNGLAICNVSPTPLPDAQIYVESSGGLTWTTTTDLAGRYQLWLPTAGNPFTITVSNEMGYEAQTAAGLQVTIGQTTTHTANLRWYAPCATVLPEQLNSVQAANQVTTKTLTLDNAGASPFDWAITEEAGRLVPIVPLPDEVAQAAPIGGAGQATDSVGSAAAAAEVSQPSAIGLISKPYVPTTGLWDNGPLVTHPGGGSGGADASAVQTDLGLSTYGFGHTPTSGNRVADDFVIGDPYWRIGTITFYAYQTGSALTSTINSFNLRIWKGVPGAPGSMVVWGDTTTNRLINTSWSNIYRVLDTDIVTGTTRPIMANTVAVNTSLPAGTYWLDWQTDGTLASGPWVPPVTRLGQTTTGNALQYSSPVGWGSVLDDGSLTQQGLPFVIDGASGCNTSIPWANARPVSGTLGADSQTVVSVTFNSAGLAAGNYTGNLCVSTTDPLKPLLLVPVKLAVSDCAAKINTAATIYASVQAAVDASTSSSDVVQVAGYCPGVSARANLTQTIIVTKALTIRGGYTTTNWTTPYPITQPTTLDALNLGRVILIKNSASVTLDGLNIVHGNGYSGGAPGGVGEQWGGGVFALTSTLHVLNSQLNDNTAFWGGGVGAEGSVLTLTHAALLSNTVGGDGGGLANYRGQAVVNDSQILYNQSTLNSGGVANDDGQLVVNRSTIGYNTSNSTNPNFGNGGLANMACAANSSLTINDSQVIYNTNPLGNGGGGVSNHAAAGLIANLVINRSTIANNSTSSYSALAGFGGGIKNGAMDLAGTCQGLGGGMPMSIATINDSVIKNNSATNGGGIGNGILPTGVPVPMVMVVTLNNTTVSGNVAGVLAGGYITQTGNGGGIFNVNGTVTAINSTLSGNAATTTSANPNSQSGLGGAIASAGAGLPTSVVLTHTTIAQNGALLGAGLANAHLLPVAGGYPATLATYGAIIANNVAAIPSYNGCLNNPGAGVATITSGGYNLESGNTCGLSATGDLTNTNPLLGALANNGGPVTGSGLPAFTHALPKSSPAVNAIPVASCTLTTDQRGQTRPAGSGCDIGAYEMHYIVYLPLIRR